MKNYIFGTGPFAIEVAKKLEKFFIEISGFLKLEEHNEKSPTISYNDIPIYYTKDIKIIDRLSGNIIITKKPMIMGETIDFLRNNNFSNVYTVGEDILFSEQESLEELSKYIDYIDFSKPFLNYLEMNVVDHCNLNCKGCAHFSNICNNNFVSVESFRSDLQMVSEKFNLYNFRILGGEPFLHPNVSELATISREILTNTKIVIVTNGLLIDRLDDKILQTIADNDIMLSISIYQPTYEILDKIIKKLNEYHINFLINDDYFRKASVIDKFNTRLSSKKGTNGELTSKICTGRFCRFLRNGKISKCYYPLLIEILNEKYGMNYIVTDDDYVEIDSIVDGWGVIDKLNDKIPFCDYCSETLHEFNWEGNHKNDRNIQAYILKKK